MISEKQAVLSLGGSLIVPSGIDTNFLNKFKRLVERKIQQGWKFIIVTGGGMTSRNYQVAAGKLVRMSNEDLDWLGIHATRLNAHLMRTIFRKYAYPVIVKNPRKKIKTAKSIIIASGWKPGWSTDYVAIEMCKTYMINTVINLSNIDYVYTADPKKDKHAQKIIEMTWIEFQKLLPKRWTPGANLPFDPIASKLARKIGTEVFIINGKNIKNLEKLLIQKPYKGTHIT